MGGGGGGDFKFRPQDNNWSLVFLKYGHIHYPGSSADSSHHRY